MLLILFVTNGCSVIRKNKSQNTSKQSGTDSSYRVKITVYTTPDTAALSGYVSISDIVGYQQEVESDHLILSTIAKPVIIDGKVIRFRIHSKTVKKSAAIIPPVNKTIPLQESGKEPLQTVISTAQQPSTSAVENRGFNVSGALAISVCLGIFALSLFRYFKK